MSWTWLAPLLVGAVGAGLIARAARALEREREELRLSRRRLAEVRSARGAERRRRQP